MWDDMMDSTWFYLLVLLPPLEKCSLCRNKAPQPSIQAFRDHVSEAELGRPVRLSPGLWGPTRFFYLEPTKLYGRQALPSPRVPLLLAGSLDVVSLCEVGPPGASGHL